MQSPVEPGTRRASGPAPARERDPARAGQADDAVKETLAFIRANSAIRFVALPFFLGAIGALAAAYHGANALPKAAIAWTGLGVCAVAATIEVALSRNLVAWWTAIGAHCEHAPHWRLVLAHRHRPMLAVVRWALFAPYLAGFGYWLHTLAARLLPADADPRQHAAVPAAVAVCLAIVATLAARTWRAAARPAPAGPRPATPTTPSADAQGAADRRRGEPSPDEWR